LNNKGSSIILPNKEAKSIVRALSVS